MCTSITLTRRCCPLSWQMNIAGSNIVAFAVVTMEILLFFREPKGISERTAFLKDGLAKYHISAG